VVCDALEEVVVVFLPVGSVRDLSLCRLRYASVILRLSSSFRLRSMLSRSKPSRRPSSCIWRAKASISRSKSLESTFEELMSDLIEAWCSTCLVLTAEESRVDCCKSLLCRDSLRRRRRSSEDSDSGCNIPFESVRCLRSSSRRDGCCVSRLRSRPPDRLFSRRLRDGDVTPTSRKLIWRACSIISRSRWSALCSSTDRSGMLIWGRTLSPGLYFWRTSSCSSVGLALSGFEARKMSSRLVTVALRRVSRTRARHDGQVKTVAPGAGGFGFVSAEIFCHSNQSFKQEPQKVCRQSRSVKG
jgi:hypothetical protein